MSTFVKFQDPVSTFWLVTERCIVGSPGEGDHRHTSLLMGDPTAPAQVGDVVTAYSNADGETVSWIVESVHQVQAPEATPGQPRELLTISTWRPVSYGWDTNVLTVGTDE